MCIRGAASIRRSGVILEKKKGQIELFPPGEE
jgi:hypothetical protein